ncbi:hypothetical protein [Polyangium sp. 15x6]|uniref:hypothetical protein n=1 Tax=Polyangium sp. 15x6 TaxID=3042687 RepID=UPI00249A981D|nr:hypothetical protein [Polyangium sp. 15x6]MDI3290924.1 hypothetical protein [Polyangium sp. 15x6]
MDPAIVPLFYLSSFSGAIMVIGGIVMLYKQKIYIDRETKQVAEVQTPVGTFKTNIPALTLFALGFVPLIYPIWRNAELSRPLRIQGAVQYDNTSIDVYAVVNTETIRGGSKFRLVVPSLDRDRGEYKVLFIKDATLVNTEFIDPKNFRNGEYELPKVLIDFPARPAN